MTNNSDVASVRPRVKAFLDRRNFADGHRDLTVDRNVRGPHTTKPADVSGNVAGNGKPSVEHFPWTLSPRAVPPPD